MASAPFQDATIEVLILTVNQCQQTLRCLESLLKSRDGGPEFRITVWDNGSTDDTATAIAELYPQINLLVCDKNLGVAGGRNAAARAVIDSRHPDFLLFLDNDMVVDANFVGALAKPFFDPKGSRIGQTQAKLRLSDEPDRLNDGGGCRVQFWLGRSRPVGFGQVDVGQFDSPGKCRACCGGAMMVRRELFETLGGFDERFNPFGPEDIDFSLRLQKLGYEAWYIPGAIAYHDVNHTVGAEYSEEYAASRSHHWMRLMKRHASFIEWVGFILIGVPIIATRVLIREGKRRNLGAIRGLVRGAFGRKG